MLIGQHADIHHRNTSGRNAMDTALEKNHLAVVERLLMEGAWSSVVVNSDEKGSYEVSAICVDLLTYHELLKAPAPTLEATRPIAQPMVWLMEFAHFLAKSGTEEVVSRLVSRDKFMNMLASSIDRKLFSFEAAGKARAATTIEAPASVRVLASVPAIGSLKPAQWEQILSWTLALLPQAEGTLNDLEGLSKKTVTTLTALRLAQTRTLNSVGLAGMQAFSRRLEAELKPRILESADVKGRFVPNDLRKTLTKELALLEPVADLLLRFIADVTADVRVSAPGVPYLERFKAGIESQLRPWSERQGISRNFFLHCGNHEVANMLFDQWHAVCAALGVQIPETAALGPSEDEEDANDHESSSE